MFIALTGDKHFESLYNEGNLKNKKGGVTMCDIVQGFVDEGREKEREELIRKMLDANLVTPEQIANRPAEGDALYLLLHLVCPGMADKASLLLLSQEGLFQNQL